MLMQYTRHTPCSTWRNLAVISTLFNSRLCTKRPLLNTALLACFQLLYFWLPGLAQDASVEAIASPNYSDSGELEYSELISRGFTPLFNRSDLSGWRNPYPHGEATVRNGEIHLLADKKFFLVTEDSYADFRLSVEIHLPEGPANSAVMFRCHLDPAAKKIVYGYQAECDGSDRRWSGGLYDESRRGWIWPSTEGRSTDQFLKHSEESKNFFSSPRIRNALKRNEWNRFVVTCVKDVITIEVNGIQTVRFRDATDARGFIGIQHHGEKGQTYRFRNLFIKELPVVPAKNHVELVEQAPIAIKRISENVTQVDFGTVAFGNIVMPVPEGRGTASVHFGEKLIADRIDRNPPGTVRYGVKQIRLGGQRGNWIVPTPVDSRNVLQAGLMYANPPAVLTPAEWQPIAPFRWIELEGLDEDFQYDLIRRRAAFSSSWNNEASSFECSNATLNQIWELCKYSIKATTFAGVYVDGDRERIPYEGDAYLNQLSHYYTDDEVTMAARTFDWLMENGTWPSEWAPHMVFMAHAEWMYSGDTEWLRQRYEALKAKTLLHRSADDGLVRSADIERTKHDIVDWPKNERDGFVFTEINTVVNAFHIKALQNMSEIARVIGKENDANAFSARAQLALNSFQSELFDQKTGLYRDGKGTSHSSIHANFFPLAFGLIPVEKRPPIVKWLASKDMECSVYAAQYFLDGLFSADEDRKALQLILANGDRSWKHMLGSGTTITWEAWGMKYKPNQDWNHAWGAAPANLLPRFVLGAQPAAPGWSTAKIRPCPGGLKHARGQVPTPRGPIQIAWEMGQAFELSLELPDGMSAEIELPTREGREGLLNGKTIAATKTGGRWILDNLVTGSATIKTQ